jgi:hypothetical protein
MTTVSYIRSVNPLSDFHTNIDDYDVGHLILSDSLTKPSESSTPSIPPTLKTKILTPTKKTPMQKPTTRMVIQSRLMEQINGARAIMESIWE